MLILPEKGQLYFSLNTVSKRSKKGFNKSEAVTHKLQQSCVDLKLTAKLTDQIRMKSCKVKVK